MLNIVHINGFIWYADINNRILYDGSDKRNGIPFSFLTKNENDQLENELRFPRN